MKKCESGFTLIESLFVLSIFLIIASITVILLKPQSIFLEKQQFFTQIKSDLLYAQAYAISRQTDVYVNINPREHIYYIYEGYNGNFLVERQFSEVINVQEGAKMLKIHFKADGNLQEFGTLYIHIGEEKYRLTFLIGKGRFYVAKE